MAHLLYAIEGMSCANCARSIESTLRRQPSVEHATVDFATEVLSLDVRDTNPQPDTLEAVEKLGFRLLPWQAGQSEEGTLNKPERIRLAITIVLSMQVMVLAMAEYFTTDGDITPSTQRVLWWISGVLSGPVLVYGGASFFRKAWLGLRTRSLGMDLLVSLGALASFSYSVLLLVRAGGPAYFDTTCMIITFLLIGRTLESQARRRGASALRKLLALTPERACVVLENGEEKFQSPEDISVGARVRIRPGERVPVDGVVVSGASHINRAFLTGEVSPVAVGPHALVQVGSVNGEGALLVEVTAATGKRAIDHLASTMRRFLDERAPMQLLADRAATYLTPTVLGLSVMAGMGAALFGLPIETSVLRAIATLVVACPCALGLATPMALTVVAGRAANRGTVFRDGEALERATRINAVMFDKTGTLSEGTLRLVRVQVSSGAELSDEELIRLAAQAERDSEHPLAQAIMSAVTNPPERSGTLTAVPGQGIIWRSDNRQEVLIGHAEFMRQSGVVLHDKDTNTNRDEASTLSVTHVACDRVYVGSLWFSDQPRPETRDVIQTLRQSGMAVGMLSGDRNEAAQALGKKVGLVGTMVFAPTSPEKKAEHIRALQRDGYQVAFVGDGINDSPALAAADLGVVVSGATGVARAAAHLALHQNGIARLPEALRLARRTRRVMRQNLGWALIYNVIALPAAAFGFITPAWAALAMALSSLSVVMNSLRLGRL